MLFSLFPSSEPHATNHPPITAHLPKTEHFRRAAERGAYVTVTGEAQSSHRSSKWVKKLLGSLRGAGWSQGNPFSCPDWPAVAQTLHNEERQKPETQLKVRFSSSDRMIRVIFTQLNVAGIRLHHSLTVCCDRTGATSVVSNLSFNSRVYGHMRTRTFCSCPVPPPSTAGKSLLET